MEINSNEQIENLETELYDIRYEQELRQAGHYTPVASKKM